ncbi:MAG: NrtR DNA-binding winged helix domain-containing protein [Solirubrobacteraceae bacterium]
MPRGEIGTPATDPPALANDHAPILAAAIDRVRGKLWWSNIAVGILPAEFTLAQAREVYEAIAVTSSHPSTFARDLRATGLISQTHTEPLRLAVAPLLATGSANNTQAVGPVAESESTADGPVEQVQRVRAAGGAIASTRAPDHLDDAPSRDGSRVSAA